MLTRASSSILPFVWLATAVIFRFVTFAMWAGVIALLVYLTIVVFDGMSQGGRVYLAPFIGLAVAMFAVIRAALIIFIPAATFDFSICVDEMEYPLVNSLVDDIAIRVGAKPPDHVLLGMSSSFHVAQSKVLLLDGERISGRILHLSAPLMRLLKRSELEAILAHELAHFTGGDTVYSVHVAPIYESCRACLASLWDQLTADIDSLVALIIRLAYVPPLVIAFVYFLGFQLIDRKISRGRELRADRLAARQLGQPTMARALIRVVGYGVVLGETRDEGFAALLAKGQTFTNYPHYFHEAARNNQPFSGDQNYFRRAEAAVLGALNESTQRFDTHPALSDRLHALDVSPRVVREALELSAVAEGEHELSPLEEELTQLYAGYLNQMGA